MATIFYNGLPMCWLRPELMHLAVVVEDDAPPYPSMREIDPLCFLAVIVEDDAPASRRAVAHPAPATVQEPSQMPLMVLPESARKRVKMRGHAAMPGTGPEGETCGSCAFYFVKRMAKTYRKCLLKKAAWTGGGGTDVRKRDAACAKWSVK